MSSPHCHSPGLLSHSLGWPGTEARLCVPGCGLLPHLLKILGTAVGQTSKKREQCPERGKSPSSLKQTLESLFRQRFLKLPKCKNHPRVFAKTCLPAPSQNDLFRNWGMVAGGSKNPAWIPCPPPGVRPPLWALLGNIQTHHVFDQQVSRGEGD